MKAFSQLYQTLDQTTSTNAKVQAMAEYFAAVNDSDAAWAVYFLSGRRLKRLITASVMRKWLVDEASLPEWLVEESYSSVGDLAETIALLVSQHSDDNTSLPMLSEQVAALKALARLTEEEQRIHSYWLHAPSHSTPTCRARSYCIG